MELRPGSQIDRYVLEICLGEGGQGAVWRAEDRLQPGRQLALKLVPMGADVSHLERVRREARHLARLKHPGLPACHALFEDLEHGYLVVAMELVQGPTLAEAAGTLDGVKKGAVLRQLAATLAFLHSSGVVHRDVKPENVILCHEFWADPFRQGSLKLIDLGISVSSGNPQPLTVVGHIIGTPSFLAPEILDPHYFPGLQDTPAADVFALGVLGWRLLFSAHPTGLADGSSMASYALAYRQADQTPMWPIGEHPEALEPLLRRCLAVRARERFASANELLAALSGADAGLSSSTGSMRSEPSYERLSSLPATRLEPVPALATPASSVLPPRTSVTPPVPSSAVPPTPPMSPARTEASAPFQPRPAPSPATVFAAPLPLSLAEKPAPSATPAPVVSAAMIPAKSAPVERRERHSTAPVKSRRSKKSEQAIEKPISVFRYIIAGVLLLLGGSLAFVLTVVLFILFSIGR